MTNEEAIETLKQLILQGTDERLKKDYEAIDIAIKALETGEVYMTGEDYNLYMEGYKSGLSDGRKDAERPQGEWIEVDIKPMPYGGYTCNRKCNKCGYFTKEYRLNFCPNCGAKMQKGGAEE